MAKAKKLPSGAWRVRVCIGKDENGKYIYKSVTADTKKEAEYSAAELLMDYREENSPKNRTLEDACYAYISSKDKVLSPCTIRGYITITKNRLRKLMKMRLADIKQADVQSAINEDAITHSPKSVRNAHGFISAVFALYRPDFTLHTTMPVMQPKSVYVPNNAEIAHLISCIDDSELLKAVMLAAFGSLRRSEICALTVGDIQGDAVTICKALIPDKDHVYVLKHSAKSKAGNRTVTLPHEVIEKLVPMQGTDRIVNLKPHQISNRFDAILKENSIPHFRFHDLRHYQASILHAMGVPDKYIMERGGWKTSGTLKNIYQHTMDEKRRNVESQICDFFASEFFDDRKKNPTENQ